jgi:NosR/NirI family transcriptional regulator, nitrous oxide reductase regulator
MTIPSAGDRRLRAIVCSVALVTSSIVIAQPPPPDGKLLAELKQLFPAATSFGPKETNPPHYKVYASGARGEPPTLAGFAFWTTELDPLERGYDGPIKMLVGMDTKGVLTGILVVEHHEPYGDISIEPRHFAEQFAGKSIRDPFAVGGDIDAVSRATITMTSATRAVRNSARRVARSLLAAPR